MSPLGSLTPTALNARTPNTSNKAMARSPSTFSSPLKASMMSTHDEDEINWDEIETKLPSSPFDDNITITSTKSKGKRLADDFSIFEDEPDPEPTPRQPRFQAKSPKVSGTFTSISSVSEGSEQKTPETEISDPISATNSLRGSTHSHAEEEQDTLADLPPTMDGAMEEDDTIDDTCFSTFSEVPDMTTFAKLGQRSPLKMFATDPARTPRAPSPGRFSKTPRDKDETTMLIDFTQQIESFSMASQRPKSRGSPTREPQLRSFLNSRRSPVKGGVPSTPGKKNILTLLDFDLPPAPTPRSIPTITVRELETLKSQYMSQISSLKATLSGREAEVESLKRAVSDAERRVGEAHELVREERSSREHVEKEKSEWEKRGTEVESVLKSIKEEVINNEKEREELVKRLEESERRAQEAETKAADAEARAAEAKSKRASLGEAEQTLLDANAVPVGLFTAEQVQKQIDERLSQLGSELHVIYKEKHINKVANLKARNQKEMSKLKADIDELKTENARLTAVEERLLAAQDGTLSGPQFVPSDMADRERELKRLDEQKAEIEEQKAKLAGMAEEVKTVRTEHAVLLKELEQERIEKGELVAAVDEMLALQNENSIAQVEDFRKSITQPSMGPPSRLQGPPSRLQGPAPTGLRGPGFGKSKMMRDLERMGSGRNVNE